MKWAEPVSDKTIYGPKKSIKFLRLTSYGKMLAKDLNEMPDVRFEMLDKYSRQEKLSFIAYSNLYQLQKIGFDLGEYENKIYARQCVIKEVDHNTTDNFLNINHIQGKVKSTYNLGLYYKNELVQLICLGSSRFKKNEVELLRMCTKLNTQVVGGFSKLMMHQPYTEVISYLDRSKFSGNGYKAIGFTVISTSRPSYKYYKDNIELNRIAAQKHKLPKLLGDDFNPDETESQNMQRCGWFQVFDCGTLKLKYEKEI